MGLLLFPWASVHDRPGRGGLESSSGECGHGDIIYASPATANGSSIFLRSTLQQAEPKSRTTCGRRSITAGRLEAFVQAFGKPTVAVLGCSLQMEIS